jgi:hypothetical protein
MRSGEPGTLSRRVRLFALPVSVARLGGEHMARSCRAGATVGGKRRGDGATEGWRLDEVKFSGCVWARSHPVGTIRGITLLPGAACRVCAPSRMEVMTSR